MNADEQLRRLARMQILHRRLERGRIAEATAARMAARDAEERMRRVEALMTASAPEPAERSVMALTAGAELRLLLGDVLLAARRGHAEAQAQRQAADARLRLHDKRGERIAERLGDARRAVDHQEEDRMAQAQTGRARTAETQTGRARTAGAKTGRASPAGAGA